MGITLEGIVGIGGMTIAATLCYFSNTSSNFPLPPDAVLDFTRQGMDLFCASVRDAEALQRQVQSYNSEAYTK